MHPIMRSDELEGMELKYKLILNYTMRDDYFFKKINDCDTWENLTLDK